MNQAQMNQAQLTRKEIRGIFKRHRGAAFKLANELGIARNTVGLVLRGKGTSKRVMEAAHKRAMELLAEEGHGQAA